jgi:hypothetical protein
LSFFCCSRQSTATCGKIGNRARLGVNVPFVAMCVPGILASQSLKSASFFVMIVCESVAFLFADSLHLLES